MTDMEDFTLVNKGHVPCREHRVFEGSKCVEFLSKKRRTIHNLIVLLKCTTGQPVSYFVNDI